MNVNKTWNLRKPESTTKDELKQNLQLQVVLKRKQKIKETFKTFLQVEVLVN